MSATREKLPPRVITQRRDLPDQIGLGRLNSVLADLQNERVDLLMKYHPTDRHVQEVDDKIANIRESLKHTQESKATEEQSDVNPLRQSVDSDLQQLTFHSAGLPGGATTESDRESQRIRGEAATAKSAHRTIRRSHEKDSGGYNRLRSLFQKEKRSSYKSDA